MDALRLGAALRTARLHRRLRQVDVARLAGVSDATVSRVERGHLSSVSVATLEVVARALEVMIDYRPRSRAGELDRFLNARHAALAEEVVARLSGSAWVARPELSFSEYGERGVIDVLAWHPVRRGLLVIEIKTEIVDVGELLGTLDRKRRLAPVLAARLGWQPATISVALIVGDSRTNRRRVAAHASTLRAVLPSDGRQLRRHLRTPVWGLAALAFWPYRHLGTTRRGWSAVRRVRPPR